VGAAVAPLLAVDEAGADGKQQLQAVVDRTMQAPAAGQAATYRTLLRQAVPADKLSGEELDRLLDPASYLGQAAEISRRILAAFPDYVRPSTEPERNGDSRG
jgi:3-carboxy-cis,cis-muconate cycloisomerase